LSASGAAVAQNKRGPALCRALVFAVADSLPRQALLAAAACLSGLLGNGAYGASAREWLLAALQSAALPGLATGQLAAGDAQRFAALLLAWPALPRGRFDALVADFSAVARGEAAADALLAYEL
jgi:hypothetical protein